MDSRRRKRLWTIDDDDVLRRMIGDGAPYKDISTALDRSRAAITRRAKDIGICANPEAVAKNRGDAMRAFYASGRQRKPPDEATRRKFAANARRRNLAGEFGVRKCSETTRKKISETWKSKADKRLNFAPRGHPLRLLYEELVCRHKMGAAEALRIVKDELAKLSRFERQMLRVQAGAEIYEARVQPAQIGEMP